MSEGGREEMGKGWECAYVACVMTTAHTTRV